MLNTVISEKDIDKKIEILSREDRDKFRRIVDDLCCDYQWCRENGIDNYVEMPNTSRVKVKETIFQNLFERRYNQA